MKFKRKTMRIVSGMLTAITLFTNALSPVIAYAAPADEADSRNHVAVFTEIREYRHIFVLLSQKSRDLREC